MAALRASPILLQLLLPLLLSVPRASGGGIADAQVGSGTCPKTAEGHCGGGGGASGGSGMSLVQRPAALVQRALSQETPAGGRSERDGGGLSQALLQQAQRLAEEAVGRAAASVAGAGAGAGAGANTSGESDSQAAAVQQILTIVEGSVHQEMVSDHDEDQDEVNRHAGYVTQCGSDLAAAGPGITESQSITTEKRTTSEGCSAGQEELNGIRESSCTAAHQYLQQHLQHPECTLTNDTAPDAMGSYITCVEQWASVLPEAHTQHKVCDNATAVHAQKTEVCTGKMQEHHTAFCTLKALMASTCGTYDACYAREAARYRDVEAKVRVVEKGRQVEAVAVAKIKCYLNIVKESATELAGGRGDELLQGCAELTGEEEAAAFVISYPGVANMTACDAEPDAALGGSAVCTVATTAPPATPAPPPPSTTMSAPRATPAPTTAAPVPATTLAPVTTAQPDVAYELVQQGAYCESMRNYKDFYTAQECANYVAATPNDCDGKYFSWHSRDFWHCWCTTSGICPEATRVTKEFRDIFRIPANFPATTLAPVTATTKALTTLAATTPAPPGISYLGCYKHNTQTAVNFIRGKNMQDCQTLASAEGLNWFGMEYPQGYATVGEATCCVGGDYAKEGPAADAECEGERDADGNRLGGPYRIAVYRIGAASA